MAEVPDIQSAFKGPVGPLRHRCAQCSATDLTLLRCGGCRAVRYCGREHQIAHRAQHKGTCNKIKKARDKLAEEEHRVRNAEPDIMTPANAFETSVGRFWGIWSTRDYMRARFALAGGNLLRLGTLDGVQEAYEHMWDMLRLCHSDNLGLRDIVPAIMLRLDLDQECYDFIKWWATCDPDGRYDWGDTTLPYLDLHGADVLENEHFFDKYPDFNHVVAILLLKLKLLVDIRNLKVTRKILALRSVPLDLWEQFGSAVIRSPLSARFLRESSQSLSRTEKTILNQIRLLGATINKLNHGFMFRLFDPDEALSDKPEYTSSGSWEEVAMALQHSYAAWWETEGILDLLNDARACAARDSENEIKDMLEEDASRPCAAGHRTFEEMLADVSVNRIWGYLDWAVENASYLGPWSERPSERYTLEAREAWERAKEEDAEFDDLSDEGEWSDDED